MRRYLTFILLISFLSGCSNLPSLLSTPGPAAVSPTVPAPTATPLSPTPVSTPGGPRVLRIWLPPQFDPSTETQDAQRMQSRLDEFMTRRPGLQIEVRVKAESGPNGLLNSLIDTYAAAPTILPDLVALPRADLESAALQGLLHPLDGLTTLLDDPDWFPYAQQMAHIQNTSFGLPFAGDALVLVGYQDPLPTDWENLDDETFIFPAGSPQVQLSLALYISAGGALIDDQGNPVLNKSVMAEVLSFYSQAVENGNLSSGVVDYQNDAASWQAFKEQRASLAVTWISQYFDETSNTLSLGLLPGLERTSEIPAEDALSTPITLARGYSWALAGSNPANQALAIELAEFLSDSEYLAEWTEAAGVLPTRPTALSSWQDTRLRATLTLMAESAQLAPDNDLTVAIGPIIQSAVEAVLSGEKTPEEAAQEASEQLQ